MHFEDSLCCLDAESDIIWTNGFLYKRNTYPEKSYYKSPPDISHLRTDDWLFDYIPF